MLVPMLGDEMEIEVPCAVKENHAKWWWGLMVIFFASTVLDIVAGDIFGVLFMGIMTFTIWYMVSSSCKQMSQYCLMMFGLMCVIQATFELVTLLMLSSGRSIRHTSVTNSVANSGSQKTQTITTVEEVHPFFDESQGLRYNAQSVSHIVAPCVLILGGFLAYWSYNAFPVSLFSQGGDEDRSFYGGQGNTAGRAYGGVNQSPAMVGGHVAGGQVLGGRPGAPPTRSIFEGTGQRLGGS